MAVIAQANRWRFWVAAAVLFPFIRPAGVRLRWCW
jgi:hypothetical protein